MHKQNHRNEGKLAVEQGREYWAPWIPPPEHLSSALLHPPTHPLNDIESNRCKSDASVIIRNQRRLTLPCEDFGILTPVCM